MKTSSKILFKRLTDNELELIDISSINSLLFQLTKHEYSLTTDQFKVIISREDVIQFYAYSSKNVSKAIGLLTLVVFVTPVGNHGRIEDVVVDTNYRRNNIGKILTEMAIDKARELNIKEVDLTSSPHRIAANKLYQKMGFEMRETNVYRYKNDK